MPDQTIRHLRGLSAPGIGANYMPFARLSDLVHFSPEKMQKNPILDCPQMVADVYCLEPGQEQRVHAHAGEAKMYCVVDGRGDFTIGDASRTLAAGEIAWSPAGVVHGVRNAYAERLTVLVVMAPNPNLRRE